MRAAAVLAALVLAACAPEQSQLPGERGAPVDTEVVTEAAAAGFADCPKGKPALDGHSLTCLTTGEPAPLVTGDLPVVINVWASWCEPCREELPLLAKAADEFEGKVRFVGIDFADAAPLEAIALAERSGIRYPQFADPDSSTRATLGLRGLPQTVFVDETGAVVGTEHTPFEAYDDLVTALETHLGVAP